VVGPLESEATQSVTIPQLITDPIWSLKLWPVKVDLLGTTFMIPELPAADWLHVLMRDSFYLEDLFPGLCEEEDQSIVDTWISEQKLGIPELWDVSLDILDTVTGRPWYVSLRIISAAQQAWTTLGGVLVREGVDASHISIAAWLDAVFSIFAERLDKAIFSRFLVELDVDPTVEPGDSLEQMEMSRDMFASFMAGQ